MAQVGIREFDAKQMYFNFVSQKYSGIQIRTPEDIVHISEEKKYVIKPDMLFGKRWKYGLVWVNLDKKQVWQWLHETYNKQQDISGISGHLNVFLLEEFVPHKEEYYISFSAQRDTDVIRFSGQGWVDVEENWESVVSIEISVLWELTWEDLEKFQIKDQQVVDTLLSLRKYYKTYGFVYLEVNPFCFHLETGELIFLDMVAKIDDQEFFKQKNNWNNLEIPNSYGFQENEAEQYIKKLDQETGASLKMKILNPNARIWTLLAGWWGSLSITDSLWALWYSHEIGNYWELSGNPNRDFTKAYTKVLFEEMLKNKIQWKYLIIAGAIANFTYIDTTFSGIIDVIEEKKEEILEQKIQILVRRWWINEKKWLSLIKTACDEMWIPIIVADSSAYMTDILKEIKL